MTLAVNGTLPSLMGMKFHTNGFDVVIHDMTIQWEIGMT
jgi:hypothetical protein